MSSPFHRQEEASPISDVNVVPLADVSLVLLIILLVLSPMAAQSMLRVQAAAAKAQSLQDLPPLPDENVPPKPPDPVLSVGLTPGGYILNGRWMGTDQELKMWLTDIISKREDKKVFLSPELEVWNGRVVSTIELIQGCGASSVALVQIADPDSQVKP